MIENHYLLKDSYSPIQLMGDLIEKPCFSFAQTTLFFIEQFCPGENLLNLGNVFKLKGNLHVSHLEESFNMILARHEALRTWICLSPAKWKPAVASKLQVKLQLAEIPFGYDKENYIENWLNNIIYRPYVFGKELLFRVGLLRADKDEHYFAFACHHGIFDNDSARIFLQELHDCYNSLQLGVKVNLSPINPYYDLALSQREGIANGLYNDHINFWKNALAAVSPILNMPTDKPRQKGMSKMSNYNFQLFEETIASFTRLANANGCTSFLLILAVIQLLIYHYAKQTCFTIGLPVLARNQPNLQNVIGLFANMLPIPAHINIEDSFVSFLKSVKNIFVQAYKYQDLPVSEILKVVEIPRYLNRQPLHQVSFSFINGNSDSFTLENLQVENYHAGSGHFSGYGRSSYDLYIEIHLKNKRYEIRFIYSEDLFAESTIKNMAQYFNKLIKNIIHDPLQTIKKIIFDD